MNSTITRRILGEEQEREFTVLGWNSRVIIGVRAALVDENEVGYVLYEADDYVTRVEGHFGIPVTLKDDSCEVWEGLNGRWESVSQKKEREEKEEADWQQRMAERRAEKEAFKRVHEERQHLINDGRLFEVTIRESSTNRCAGANFDGSRTIVTNRPEAVNIGETSEEKERGDDELFGSNTIQDVWVDPEKLGDDGFIATIEKWHWNHCGHRFGVTVKKLAGREVSESEFFFGSAYAEWAELMEDEAVEYLFSLGENKSRRVRHSLLFAAGRAHGFAPHEERRRAWGTALRGLGLKGQKARVGSIRTAPVRAAQALGWKPSVPQPEYWEGLPEGVTEVK